ncbi:tellurite resistance TerB family protein [Leptothoe sp. PORK10 BA2]|uniref:tellurite resistance TerB family protein n=1 Tax=Leptothoe sp. PORK10 BA2 TaxID=3110254 RepID=UPI002B1FC9F8|nr:tellurite resistance TerB family protein [Leptothoe sp. PORK10 BA2]MEA5463087.1 tellurite resistance TerB family protein [Leptothoe sp. PORK10 BA2]
MGLFDQVFDPLPESQSLTPAEALAAICLVAIAADGYLSDQEGLEMDMLLSRMRLFKSYSNEMINRMKDSLLQQLQQHGPSRLVESANTALPIELKPTAFALATDLVLADGNVTPQEQAFLDDLYRILDIPSDRALTIVEVMTVKNRG